MRVQTVWPGGWVELPEEPPAEPAFRVVTTAKTSGDWRPRTGKARGRRKPPPQWLERYLRSSGA